MAHYINKDALVTEIGRLKKSLPWGSCASQISMECNCKNEAYNDVISLANSMEVKEVDLDKELEDWLGKRIGKWTGKECERMCRHFFKLGLKAQKGE